MNLAGGLPQNGAWTSTFEPFNFNVTKALIDHGVDVATIPLWEQTSISPCSAACSTLQSTFADEDVLFEGTTEYNDFTGAYWAAQQVAVNPHCVFKPSSPDQVATAVLLSRLTQCPFAVKGGGHAAFAGGSSIEDGITIALEKLDEIILSEDKKIATIGPGNRWLKVYQTLEKEDVAVIGGRVSTVGVSGLTLGGGISHFANAHGWACDNVDSYEVVIASGTIVTASVSSHADLFWALRGGGNNFGIVTKFNMRTFPSGPMWGGPRLYERSDWDAMYTTYEKVARIAAQDIKQAQFMSFGMREGVAIGMSELEYAEPTPWPEIFADWKAIPAAQDYMAVSNLSQLTANLGGSVPDGIYETYWGRTYKLDSDLIKFSVDTMFEMMPAIESAAGILPALTFQAITVSAMEKMQQNGGNALGLDPSKGPIYIANLAIMWTDAVDNERVYKFSNELYERIQVEAERRGLQNDFVYMNYASPWQDVVSSYGVENQARLMRIADEFDPTGVYQKLQPGYHKLEGKPFGAFPA